MCSQYPTSTISQIGEKNIRQRFLCDKKWQFIVMLTFWWVFGLFSGLFAFFGLCRHCRFLLGRTVGFTI